MVLFLDNDAQSHSITADEAITALKNGLRQFHNGDAIRRPRIDNFIPTNRKEEWFNFSSMEGGMRKPGYYALRIKPDIYSWPVVKGVRRTVNYNTKPGTYGGLVFLFDTNNGALLAILNDGYIQHLRVAATAAIGAEYLSHKDSRVMAVLGSGGFARSFAEAIHTVRDLDTIRVFSPNRAHAKTYAKEVSRRLSLEAMVSDTPEIALRGADIVIVCTNSMEPVIKGKWLEPGSYLANVRVHELGPDVFDHVDVLGLLVDNRPMSLSGYVDRDFGFRYNVMSYAAGQQNERKRILSPHPVVYLGKARYVQCVDWRTGRPYRRKNEGEIAMISNDSSGAPHSEAGGSSNIQGIQFVSIASEIYANARKSKVGRELPSKWFLQNIRT